jgi:hypothetical protein
MIKAAGFLSGVCLSVAALLLMLDSRQRQQPEIVTQAIADATAEELSVVYAAIAEQVDVMQAENESDQTSPPEHESETADSEPQSGFEASGPDQDEHRLDAHAVAETVDFDLPDNGDAGTYLFWSPFRSEWAARGFAGRLTSATQVPVEVINAGPGEYRAAFSYQDETERLARIERIETITGLKLE